MKPASESRQRQVGGKERPLVCDHVPSLLGELFFAVTQKGMVRLAFGIDRETFIMELAAAGFPSPAFWEPVPECRRQLEEYFRGERNGFDLPVDWTSCTAFQKGVLEAVCNIPRGETRTYGEIAAAVANPRASRAVGGALAGNQIPIVIPCHRVVGVNGRLTGYTGSGGTETKRFLLEMEGYPFLPRFSSTAAATTASRS